MTALHVPVIPGLTDALEAYADRLDLELLDRAYRFSAAAHRGQKRWSGEDAVTHGIAIARILIEAHLDSTSVGVRPAARRDRGHRRPRVEDLEREFGAEIATIVDGLTKISSLTFRSTAEEQAENYRKLLLVGGARTRAS